MREDCHGSPSVRKRLGTNKVGAFRAPFQALDVNKAAKEVSLINLSMSLSRPVPHVGSKQRNTTWRWLTALPAGHGEWPDLITGRRAAGRTAESSAAGPAAVAAGLCQGAGQSPQGPGLLPGCLRSHPHASPPSPVDLEQH
ncbi:uncharacterized protein LOC144143546 isoform X2 [Haemaphysalis longicornis]